MTLTIAEMIKGINKAVPNVIVTEPADVKAIPSGSLYIDQILGVGGYPFNRITEIYGGESAGKSTVCMTLCANAQKMGIIPTYVDVETAIDIDYAHMLGVDTDKWILAQPDYAEEAYATIEAAIVAGSKLIILDSVGSLIGKRETIEESDMEDQQIGLVARVNSRGVRRLTPFIKKHDVALVFINQMRAKIGAMPGTSTEDTPGGKVLKHGYGVRMKITRTGKETGDDPDYITSKVYVEKNKVAPPYRKNIITIRFGSGIDLYDEMLEIAVANKIVKKSGAWYSYNNENIGQGSIAASQALKTNPEIYNKVFDSITFKCDKDFYKANYFK